MEENETVSVSKGVFVFKDNFKRPKKSTSKKPSTLKNSTNDMFSSNLWYQEFVALWGSTTEEIEKITVDMFSSMTTDLLDFVKNSHQCTVSEIPTAALLTGINMPDHEAQFKALKTQIKEEITPHVAFLHSQNCTNLKYLMENMIDQLVNEDALDTTYFEVEMDTNQHKNRIKKNLLNLPLLQSWYEDQYPQEHTKDLLVVIMPDFESFNAKVLQNFILITSLYLDRMPFVFIFGLATSIGTLHISFPYHVTSKMSIKIFKCEPSTVHLNKILETVFLQSFCAFHLGGNVFNLFTDIFLFYDFSVRNFVQNIKYAMIEHFCYGNAMALCNLDKKEVIDILSLFNHEDCENVRQLMSFRKLVESDNHRNRIKLLTDDEYFKTRVCEKIVDIQRYIRRLHIFLEVLLVLVMDLPGVPLGKQLRELYATAASTNITKTPQYKECFQLLHFQSKDELYMKLKKINQVMSGFINESSKKTQLKDFYTGIKKYLEMLDDLDVLNLEEKDNNEEMECAEELAIGGQMDRKALREALLGRSKQKSKPLNKYEKLRKDILDFISKNLEIYLVEPSSFYFYEIFFFDDISIQNKIIGMHRSSIHNALNDPHYYLQCACCDISTSTSIKSTMPDICIAYKLHLECGKMINLYDWLQAFLCIVDPNDSGEDDSSKKVVDPELQARFTQAVAELEYLGFIKSSKRKADHVSRLTWGG